MKRHGDQFFLWAVAIALTTSLPLSLVQAEPNANVSVPKFQQWLKEGHYQRKIGDGPDAAFRQWLQAGGTWDPNARSRHIFDPGNTYQAEALQQLERVAMQNHGRAQQHLRALCDPKHEMKLILSALDYFAQNGAVDLVVQGTRYPLLPEGYKRFLAVRRHAVRLLAKMEIKPAKSVALVKSMVDLVKVTSGTLAPGDAQTAFMIREIRMGAISLFQSATGIDFSSVKVAACGTCMDGVLEQVQNWLASQKETSMTTSSWPEATGMMVAAPGRVDDPPAAAGRPLFPLMTVIIAAALIGLATSARYIIYRTGRFDQHSVGKFESRSSMSKLVR